MLPDMEGMEILRRMRTAKVQTPIMILSGLSHSDDKVMALTAGADDYLTKPFDKAELIARIQAIVRRANGHSDPIIRTGTLQINLDTRLVDLGGQRIHLTRREYAIMELLALHMGSTQTKDVIMSHLTVAWTSPRSRSSTCSYVSSARNCGPRMTKTSSRPSGDGAT